MAGRVAADLTRAPAVTVLLPTHNRADVLPFAVASVLRQTVADFELIVVGDGCTDGTSDYMRSVDDPRVMWLDLPKGPGLGYGNRNWALEQARGRVIAYQAHDDLWLPDHLATMLAAMQRTGAEFAYSRSLFVTPDGDMWPRAGNLNDPSFQHDFLSGKPVPIASCTVLHTRDCLEKYGGWDESLLHGGDRELWRRIVAGGDAANFVFVPQPTTLRFLANWRRGEGGSARKGAGRPGAGRAVHTMLPALRLQIPDGCTEQEAAWRRIEADPAGYPAALREAVIAYHDGMLWQLSGDVTLAFATVGARFQRMAEGVRGRRGQRHVERMIRRRDT